jgi:hypothetical protein
MRETTDAYRIFALKILWNRPVGRTGVDERIILKCIFYN